MNRIQQWSRMFRRATLRQTIERETARTQLKARRLRLEPLEERRVMAVAVEAFTPTNSGFTAQLSEQIRVEQVNLYDAQSGAMGDADVTLRGESVGDVRGSLIITGNELTFVATGGVLPPDTYTATLRSAEDGIVDAALGELLDGEFDGQFPSGDGVPGGDFVFSFTVSALPQLVVSLPDFARGPDQPVNVPAIGTGQEPQQGLPIRFSETVGVTSLTMTIHYDPSMLDVSDVVVGRDAPAGSQVEANLMVPGQITLAFFSLDPLEGGAADLIELVASVPEDAPYGEAHVLRIGSLEVNAGAIDAIGDDAVHVVAFVGDANRNRRYDAEDARLVARVGVELDSGFVVSDPTGSPTDPGDFLYPLLDPLIIGDVTGIDGISPLDASDLLRVVVGLSAPNIPALPAAQPPIGLTLSATTIDEGLPAGTVVGTFTTEDPDLSDTHTYSLVAGEGDDDNDSFAIDGDTLITAAVFDAGVKSSYRVRVRTTDPTGRSFEQSFTVSVNEVNQAPTAITLQNAEIEENQPAGSIVGQLSTTDPNVGDTHTYTLVDGDGDDDNASFEIDGDQLVTTEVFDFETQSSYSVRVRSTDSGGLFTEAVLIVSVTDVNEAPTAITLSDSTVAGDAEAGAVVGMLETADPDEGDSHVYTLVDGEGDDDNGLFEIVGSELRLAEPLDFAQQESFSVRVRSTDSGELFTEAVFVITQMPVNEPPMAIVPSGATVMAGAPIGTVVGSFSTIDPDEDDTHVYTLVEGEGADDIALFEIDGADLKLAAELDFEQQESYSVRVRSTDSGDLSVEAVFVITEAI